MDSQRLKQFALSHQLVIGIVGVLFVALILTVISVSIYITSGASRLDLSRPGYEQVRAQVSAPEPTEKFSSDGPINADVMESFNKRLDKELRDIQKAETFQDATLENEQLQLQL